MIGSSPPIPDNQGGRARRSGVEGLLSELNWELLVVLVLASSVVAYVGDVVGMRIGKRRISLLGLRPRYTSRVITILTGVGITLTTLAVVAVPSETVRGALFGMKVVQRQITDLTAQLQTNREDAQRIEFQLFQKQQELEERQKRLGELEAQLKEGRLQLEEAEKALKGASDRAAHLEAQRLGLERELSALQQQRGALRQSISTLSAESARLKEGLQAMKEGRITVFAGELLAQVVVPEEASAEAVHRALGLLKDRARMVIAARSGIRAEKIEIRIDGESEARNGPILVGSSRRRVVRLLALQNTVATEPVEGELKVYDSLVVFREGELLASGEAPKGVDEEEAERILFSLLREVNQKAVRRGVLPDPLRGTVGNVAATDFYAAVDRIEGSETALTIRILAEKTIGSEGPVRAKILIDPK
jgi:hypothetical protein